MSKFKVGDIVIMNNPNFDYHPMYKKECDVVGIENFSVQCRLAGQPKSEIAGWSSGSLMLAPKNEPEIPDNVSPTGAVRSNDVDEFDFCSYPLLGLIGGLKVAKLGGDKYGRFNYVNGFPQHEIVNHIALHLIRYVLGDRSEDNLAKIGWGAHVAAQNELLHPELCLPHMLGPGMTITPEMAAHMAVGAPDRAAKRKSGLFEKAFNWVLGDLTVVKGILAARKPAKPDATA